MKYQYFNCQCGYKLLTASDDPLCPQCGLLMMLVTDKGEKDKMNKEFRPIMKKIAFGPGGDH
jgi:DNA-directed RNA polymerase subunit RPC12/RpoP